MDITKILEQEATKSHEKVSPCQDNARWGRSIREYEHYLGISFSKTLNSLRKRQNHPIIVLDIMCGAGTTVMDLNRDYGIDAFGVDINYYPEHRDLGFENRFIISSADNLSIIPDNSIDLILNLNGITEFLLGTNEVGKAVGEALRVLSPGGELHATPFSSKEDYWDGYSLQGYRAIEEYEKLTKQILSYHATRRLSWHRIPPVRMGSVLHLTKTNNNI